MYYYFCQVQVISVTTLDFSLQFCPHVYKPNINNSMSTLKLIKNNWRNMCQEHNMHVFSYDIYLEAGKFEEVILFRHLKEMVLYVGIHFGQNSGISHWAGKVPERNDILGIHLRQQVVAANLKRCAITLLHIRNYSSGMVCAVLSSLKWQVFHSIWWKSNLLDSLHLEPFGSGVNVLDQLLICLKPGIQKESKVEE